MKALNINLNTCLMRPLAAAFVAVLVLSGCATRDKDGIGKDDAFMQHWQNQSVDRQGFSPALEDLAPEPRVLMKQQSVNLHGTPRARCLISPSRSSSRMQPSSRFCAPWPPQPT